MSPCSVRFSAFSLVYVLLLLLLPLLPNLLLLTRAPEFLCGERRTFQKENLCSSPPSDLCGRVTEMKDLRPENFSHDLKFYVVCATPSTGFAIG
ncbi:hypothetical protein WMY93_005472 [Mugilogobius chulae]|uniref:Secreted protein n=1 Tax=Mugilogobius chulae TaxID=88201 RepID=A0AAW0PH68_9GOBI